MSTPITLVKDVRTYYQEHLSAPTFTQALTRIREEAKQDAAGARAKRLYLAEQCKEQRAVARLHPRLLRQAQLLHARDRRAYGRAKSVPAPTGARSGQHSRLSRPRSGGKGDAACGRGTNEWMPPS